MSLVIIQADAFVKNISHIAPRLVAATRTTILNSRNLVKSNIQASKISMSLIASKSKYLVTRPSLKKVGKVPSTVIQNRVAYPLQEMELMLQERWYQENSAAIRQKINKIETFKNQTIARIIESNKVQFLKYLLKRPSLKKSGKLTSSEIEEGAAYSSDEIHNIFFEKRYQENLKALKSAVSWTGLFSACMYGVYMLPVEDFSMEIDIF